MRIIVDAMGGDNAPEEIVKGAVRAKRELGVDVTLVGIEDKVRACLKAEGCADGEVEVVNASEIVTMEDDPSTATRRKKDSSMAVALTMLKDGKGDAVVSAGSTGALLTGATLTVKRIRGIRRAAMAPVLPSGEHGVMLIDCGANVECTAEYLLQFAYMGSFYAKKLMGCENPRVGLLSNGAEAEKGNALTRAAHALLLETPVRFTGNCEAREALMGGVDVLVCDGFDGNVLLKGIEGAVAAMMAMLREGLGASLRTKAGAALSRPAFRALKHALDYTEHGGAPLLGVRGGVIKAHGSSGARAFANAILQAERLAAGGVTERIAAALSALPAED